MLIKELKLYNYRNYARKNVVFDPELNIITGPNGIGKTNILESIIVVSNTKSFRTNNDQNLIKKDSEFSKIELSSDTGRYKVVLGNKSKSLYINDVLIKKSSEFIGKLNAILFKPNDLEIFVQAPNERRKVLDIEISKVSRSYIRSLLQYNYLLKEKNRLLKETEVDGTLLETINEQMVPLIKTILEERDYFFEVINRHISAIYNRISASDSEIRIIYRKCCETAEIANKLEEAKEKDFYYHYSTFGPHHDDYSFLMDSRELNAIASQGQKRMTLIAFKFALIEYVKEKTDKIPIVLLDDILSELDRENQERLIRIMPADAQVIITNTDIKDLNIDKKYKLIELKEEAHV
ncbi:MAG: DNA replication/repair protein RecF [Erysipelotrichaceae bacterium]|nr:DNA replication/repair protein RecF [Erysipelotrichaceae bacterium]